MKQRFYFDIMDEDVTPIIYHLIWAMVYPTSNDSIHEIEFEENFTYGTENITEFNERMKYPEHYCYTNKKLLAELKNKGIPTFDEAIAEYKRWLRKHGIPDNEPVLVKIWW